MSQKQKKVQKKKTKAPRLGRRIEIDGIQRLAVNGGIKYPVPVPVIAIEPVLLGARVFNPTPLPPPKPVMLGSPPIMRPPPPVMRPNNNEPTVQTADLEDIHDIVKSLKCPAKAPKLTSISKTQLKCNHCPHTVYRCMNLEEVRFHASKGHCVVLDYDVIDGQPKSKCNTTKKLGKAAKTIQIT